MDWVIKMLSDLGRRLIQASGWMGILWAAAHESVHIMCAQSTAAWW